MFKSKRILSLMASTAVFVLAACGGGNAYADEVYRVTANIGIGSGEIVKARLQQNGYLEITSTSGQVFSDAAYDPSGVILNAIRTDNPKWIFTGTTLYAMDHAIKAVCTNQGSAIYWGYSIMPEVVNDGCQIAYQNAVNGKQTYR